MIAIQTIPWTTDILAHEAGIDRLTTDSELPHAKLVKNMRLPAPVLIGLRRMGIITAGDLANLTPGEVLSIHRCGRTNLALVREALSDLGLCLAGDSIVV